MNTRFFSPFFTVNILFAAFFGPLVQTLSAEEKGSLIREARFHSKNHYKVIPNGFIVGAKIWTDRKYTVSKIPEELIGATLIQTPMEDRANRNKILISFVTQDTCSVYVGIKEGRQPPAWANSWKETKLTAKASNSLIYYRKAFSKGETVVLGDAPGLHAMYSVAVMKDEAPNSTGNDEGGWVNLLEGDRFDLWEKGPSKARSQEIGDRWSIKDGVIHLDRDAEKGSGGQIWTKKKYDDFELKFEFNIAHDGNSGIKYRAIDNDGRALGCEYQIIDDENYRDNKNPTHRTACLYELVAVPADRKWNPAGEWNSGRIVVSNNTFEHWLNGVKVVSIEFGSDDWKERFAKSKYKVSPDFAKKAGPIVLTDHGDSVSYRNLSIRELESKATVKPKENTSRKTAAASRNQPVEPLAYTTNCKACHILDQVVVGPSLVELAELYPRKKRDEFIQWTITPGRKRDQMPQMPSMAHIPKDQLGEIYDYIKAVTVGVKRIRRSGGDPYAAAPATTKRPRIIRTFVPEASPASLILALPTPKKHNVIWDTARSRLRYISVGETDNYPYLRSNGNSYADVGTIIYRETQPIFNSDEIHYKGYHLSKEGYPSFIYRVGEAEITETISVKDNAIVRHIKGSPKLPRHWIPGKGGDQLEIATTRSENSVTITYTAK